MLIIKIKLIPSPSSKLLCIQSKAYYCKFVSNEIGNIIVESSRNEEEKGTGSHMQISEKNRA